MELELRVSNEQNTSYMLLFAFRSRFGQPVQLFDNMLSDHLLQQSHFAATINRKQCIEL